MEPVAKHFRHCNKSLVPKAILFTSLPKCGTHLLLKYFPSIGFELAGPFGEIRWDDSFINYIINLKPGQYCAWHYHWAPEFSSILAQRDIRVVFLYRDPRAHVVTTVYWIMKTPSHPWHTYFVDHLETMQDRFVRVIKGIPVEDIKRFIAGEIFREPIDYSYPRSSLSGGVGNSYGFREPIDHNYPRSSLPGGVSSLYGTYARWLEEPWCLPVKFEDLIGAKGGGDSARQLEVIQNLINFTGVTKPEINAQVVADALFDENASTFRKGTIGSWREDFTEDMHQIFMKESGELLSLFGYDI